MNRSFRLLGLLALFAVPALAVKPGDTLAEVLEEKGPPAGRMEAAGAVVLRYADEVITVRDGKVASVKPTVATPAGTAAAKPTPPPASVKAAPRAAAPVEAQWSTDYAAALERAKAENRKVFLFFTGSDWCGWCKRLDKEILTTADFINYAGQDLVLVKLDFPRGFKLPADVVAQNNRLAKQYRVGGYPTVIVLNSDGKAIGQLGYQEGGPRPFVQQLRKL